MSAEHVQHVLNKWDQFGGVKRRLSTMSSLEVQSCVFSNQGHSRLVRVPGAWVFVVLRVPKGSKTPPILVLWFHDHPGQRSTAPSSPQLSFKYVFFSQLDLICRKVA